MQKIEKTIIKNVDYFDMRGVVVYFAKVSYVFHHSPSFTLSQAPCPSSDFFAILDPN